MPEGTEMVELEKVRIDAELSLKIAELDLKREELQFKLNEGQKKSGGVSPLTVAVISGIIGLLAAAAGNFLQTRSNLNLEREKFESNAKLEREKFESSLILKAIETGNPESATKNLLFLVRTGLITDRTGKIGAL